MDNELLESRNTAYTPVGDTLVREPVSIVTIEEYSFWDHIQSYKSETSPLLEIRLVKINSLNMRLARLSVLFNKQYIYYIYQTQYEKSAFIFVIALHNNKRLDFKQKFMMKKNKKYKLFWNGSKSYVVRKQKDFKWLANTLRMDYPGLKMPPLVGKSSRTLKVNSDNRGFHKSKLKPICSKGLISWKAKAGNVGN